MRLLQFLNEYRVKKRNVATSTNGDVSYNSAWLKDLWSKCNEQYFDGILKEIPLSWKTMNGSNGYCRWNFDTWYQEIYNVEIVLSNNLDDFQAVKNVLVHEMVHQYVNQTITSEQIKKANYYGGRAMSTKWKKELCLTDLTAHEGRWKEKCQELMQKDSSLHLQRIGGGNRISEIKDENGNIKQDVIDNISNAHALVRKMSNGKKYFYLASDNFYKKLIEKMYTEPYFSAGRGWWEYKFDTKEMANTGLKIINDLGEGAFKYKVFTWLCREGVIKKYTEKQVVGEKTTEDKFKDFISNLFEENYNMNENKQNETYVWYNSRDNLFIVEEFGTDELLPADIEDGYTGYTKIGLFDGDGVKSDEFGDFNVKVFSSDNLNIDGEDLIKIDGGELLFERKPRLTERYHFNKVLYQLNLQKTNFDNWVLIGGR